MSVDLYTDIARIPRKGFLRISLNRGKSLKRMVARGGIEPPTRGFSVPSKTA
jgi:hypothetical protein